MISRFVILSCCSGLLVACSRSPSPSPEVTRPAPAKVADWQVFEDEWLRVDYPPGSAVVGFAKDGKQDPKNLGVMIGPPSPEKYAHGSVMIQPDPKTQGMLLRDAIQAEMRSMAQPRSVVHGAPKEIPAKNGRCLGFMITYAQDGGCHSKDPACYHPTKVALCDAPDGRRFHVLSLLSGGTDQKTITPEAQREAAIYERILNSLEFKKS